jgi:hypothetical protein
MRERGVQAMYQLKEIESRHERLVEAGSKHLPARRNESARPGAYLRVVRVPGGFAYVADRPATGEA